MTVIQTRLFSLADKSFGEFQSRLIPTVPKSRVIGVRTPALRAYAKELYGTPQAQVFLGSLPHMYFEEDNLHAFIVERIADFDECLAQVERFLPFIDNWATCDQFFPRVFKKQPERLEAHIRRWIDSGLIYTVRFAIGALMRCFLDEHYDPGYLALVAGVDDRGEYYLRMMKAWYFATAAAKRYDDALPYIDRDRLGETVLRMTVKKACESFRVSDEHKREIKNRL